MEKFPKNNNLISNNHEYDIVEDKQNIEIKDFSNYFEQFGAKICKPLPVKRENKTTLFVSSGVQLLDDCIHDEDEIPEGKLFVAQPVIRTQFIGSEEPESHTSFYNLSLLEAQCSFDEHIANFESFLEFLEDRGLTREEMTFSKKKGRAEMGSTQV